MPRSSLRILGIPVDTVTTEETLAHIERAIAARVPLQIATVNPEFLVAAQTRSSFRTALKSAQLRIPDGAGLRALALFLRFHLPTWQPARMLVGFFGLIESGLALFFNDQRVRSIMPEVVTGTDLVELLARRAATHGWRLYLAGGKPGVAAETAAILRQRYPGIRIVGAEEGPPDPAYRTGDFEAYVTEFIDRIRAARPDILFLAFGAPKQDEFLHEHQEKLGVPVTMGVGGAFDFISGRVRRAPAWLRSLGLEWLWRLVLQPWRAQRIWTAVIIFPWLVFWERQHRPFRRAHPGNSPHSKRSQAHELRR